MIVAGLIEAMSGSGVTIELQDVLFVSTVTNYLSILADSRQYPGNRKPLRYNSREAPMNRRASFCGNAQTPKADTLPILKDLFKKQSEESAEEKLQGFCSSREFGEFSSTDFFVGQRVVGKSIENQFVSLVSAKHSQVAFYVTYLE